METQLKKQFGVMGNANSVEFGNDRMFVRYTATELGAAQVDGAQKWLVIQNQLEMTEPTQHSTERPMSFENGTLGGHENAISPTAN